MSIDIYERMISRDNRASKIINITNESGNNIDLNLSNNGYNSCMRKIWLDVSIYSIFAIVKMRHVRNWYWLPKSMYRCVNFPVTKMKLISNSWNVPMGYISILLSKFSNIA